MECDAFLVQVDGPVAGSAQSAAEATTALVRELRTRAGLDATRACVAPTGQPGSKGATADALAEIVISGLLAGSTVTAFAQIAVAFIQRGAARKITLRDGARSLTVSDPSEGTQLAVVAWLAGLRSRDGTGSDAS